MVIPGISKFPSSALQGNRVPAANPANNACAGQPCTGLFAPKFSKGYVNTTHQFQPRLGIAYQLDDRTVIRAAGGEFVTRMGLLDNIFPGGNPPFQPFLTVNNVSVDNPGASLTPNINAALTVTTLAKNLVPPTRWNWNLTIRAAASFQLGHVDRLCGSPRAAQLEGLRYQPTGARRPAGKSWEEARTIFAPIRATLRSSRSKATGAPCTAPCRLRGTGASPAGFFAGVSYTWSKSLDNSSNYRDIMPYTAYSNNLWGPSEYDTRNIVIVNYLYELPFFRSQQTLVGKLAGGWTLSGNSQFQSGTPCGVGGGSNDYAGVGEVGSFGCGGNTTEGQFWVRNGTPSMPKKFGRNGTHAKYFNPTNGNGQPIFTPPPAGTFNLQSGIRDEIYQPGLQNWNLNMFKKFAINERTNVRVSRGSLQLRESSQLGVQRAVAPCGQTGGLK